MNRSEILDEAAMLISGDRQEQYGDAADQFTLVAERWNQYPRPLTARHVALMMADLKTVRLIHKHKADSAIDAAGYVAIAGEIGEQP